jgi:hypothetical protein
MIRNEGEYQEAVKRLRRSGRVTTSTSKSSSEWD